MPVGAYHLQDTECCLGGFVYRTCTSCGGHPRQTCTTCNGSRLVKEPCPYHSTSDTIDDSTVYNSTYGNYSTYGGTYETRYGECSSYGQQSYGSTSAH